MRIEIIDFKIEQYRGIQVTIVTASSLVKEIRSSFIVGASRAYFNGRNKENIYSNSMPESADSVYTTQPIYYGSGQKKLELL